MAWQFKGLTLARLERCSESLDALTEPSGCSPMMYGHGITRPVCTRSRAARKKSLECHKNSLELEPGAKELAKTDSDLDSLRDNPEFKKLVRYAAAYP